MQRKHICEYARGLSRKGLTGNPLDESINWRRFYFLETIDLSHNKFDGSATLEKFMSPLEELNIQGHLYSGTLHLGVVLPNLRKLTVPGLQFTSDFDDVHTKKMQEIASLIKHENESLSPANFCNTKLLSRALTVVK